MTTETNFPLERSPELLCVPRLHAALAPAGLPAGTRFFDPGHAALDAQPEVTARLWRPETLPLAPRDARRCLAQLLEFGQMHGDKPADMALHATLGTLEAEAAAAARGTRAEFADLERLVKRGGFTPEPGTEAPVTPEETARFEALVRAQMYLLLAWTMEERVVELLSLEANMARTWERMGEVLGVERGDAEAVDAGLEPFGPGAVAVTGELALPWRGVMESLLAFVPEGVSLVTGDAELLATWRDVGVTFRAIVDAGTAFPANLSSLAEVAEHCAFAEAPGWLLAGRSGSVATRPWLDRGFRVVALDQA